MRYRSAVIACCGWYPWGVIVSRSCQVTAGSSRVLRAINVDVAADSRANGGQVAFVGAYDEVAAPEGTFDNAGVDDVGGPGSPGES
jgi:hypothetical protein